MEVPTSLSFKEAYWFVNIRRIDYHLDIFKKYLAQINFAEVFEETDPNEAYRKFLSIFVMIFDLCVPLERIKVSHQRKPNWKSKGIQKSSRNKRSMYLKLQKNKRKKATHHSYRNYCRTLKKVIRTSKIISNDRFINDSGNKPKATWALIKQHTSLTNSIPKMITEISLKEKTFTDPCDIAEAFNDYFVNQNVIGSTYNTHKVTSKGISNSIFLAPVDSNEIRKIVAALRNKKSSGYDNIPMSAIKSCIHYIAEPLAHIINLTLETGIFPEQLKKALIKPLYKKGTKIDIENYRPIALLPNFSKIFEKVIYNRLTTYLNKNNILSPSQFGFQKAKSTSLAVFKIFQQIWDLINEKKCCVSLLLDMSKAFDCVVHDILLQQLEHIGVRGNALQLFKSYLCSREQAVVIDKYDKTTKTFEHIQSGYEKVVLGVPQGSVLGPLLFLIYLNDLPLQMDEPCVMFADDATVLFSSDKGNTNLNNNINCALSKITQWLLTLNLKVNLGKTKIIQFKNYKSEPLLLSVSKAGTEIEEVSSANFLGVKIDSHLNWKSHIDQLNKKISSGCYALSILSGACSETVVKTAYYGSVYPLLTYGVIYWGNSVDVNSTFILQKKCIRAIYRMRTEESLRYVFKEKRFLTLTGIYILELCLFVKNQLGYFSKMSSLKCNIRQQYKYNLQMPRVNNSIYKKCTYVMAIRIFNHLPIAIKALEGVTFKRKLKNWLLERVFYNLNEFYNDYYF